MMKNEDRKTRLFLCDAGMIVKMMLGDQPRCDWNRMWIV